MIYFDSRGYYAPMSEKVFKHNWNRALVVMDAVSKSEEFTDDEGMPGIEIRIEE